MKRRQPNPVDENQVFVRYVELHEFMKEEDEAEDDEYPICKFCFLQKPKYDEFHKGYILKSFDTGAECDGVGKCPMCRRWLCYEPSADTS
ncbi:hypothetical protein PSPO01_03551 [Paraphaeosphaeria sporulosa]